MRAIVSVLCLGLAGCGFVETSCACTADHQMKEARVSVGVYSHFEGDFETILRVCREQCEARPKNEL